MGKNRRKAGDAAEKAACRFLEQNSVKILARNVKSYRGGEIDIVGCDAEGTFLFVEVKYRRSDINGVGAEAVTPAKIYNICRAADYYRVVHNIEYDAPCRFDVVSISGEPDNLSFEWIKDAFEYIGKG